MVPHFRYYVCLYTDCFEGVLLNSGFKDFDDFLKERVFFWASILFPELAIAQVHDCKTRYLELFQIRSRSQMATCPMRFFNMRNSNRIPEAGLSHLENPSIIFSLPFEDPLMICVSLMGKPTRIKLYIFNFVVGFSNGPIMFSLT